MKRHLSPSLRVSTASLLLVACATFQPGEAFGQDQPTVPLEASSETNTAETQAPAAPANPENYDYGHVLTIFKDSIGPVRSEMGAAVNDFRESMKRSNELMDAGEFDAAIEYTLASMQKMLELRDRVVEPLLLGQEAMVAEMSPLRNQLAKALSKTKVDGDPKSGLDALSAETRAQLTRLAQQYKQAPTDNARRLAEQKFRTMLRIAQLKQRSHNSDRVIQAKRRLIERLDQMLAVLGELSVNAELTFAAMDSQSELFEQYRESLKLARTAQEAEQQLSEIFGPQGFGGALEGLDDTLEAFSVNIDDQLISILDELSDSVSNGTGAASDIDTLKLMNQLLEESE